MSGLIKVLADFAQHGRIGRARTDIEEIHLCPATKKVLQDYEQYGKDRLQLRPATLQRRSGELTIFLDFLSSRKARTLDQIQVLDLSEFLSFRGHLKPNTVSRLVSDVRSFLRFLTMRGILQKLRAGDIRTLKLDHLHWEDSRIEFTQSKTTTPLSLPLTEEVGEALIDYLRSGRPKTADREIFLKLNPPFNPFGRNNNLYDVVTYWRQLAGITFRTPQRRGIHSLRHSLATRLLEQGTPFPTIADILGHTSLASTRIYAKADVEALRSVALDPEEVNHAE